MDNRLHIFIIAATEERARALAGLLEPGHGQVEYRLASDAEAVREMAAWPWDLILVDPGVPGCDLPSLLGEQRLRGGGPPVLAVPERADLDEAVELMRLGAVDYVREDDLGRLPDAVGRALERGLEQQSSAGEDRFLQFAQFSIEKAVEAVFWIDVMGRFVFVNEAAGALLGYSRHELLRLTSFDVNPLLTRRQWTEMWENLRDKRSLVVCTELLARDGSVVPAEVSLNLLVLGDREYLTTFARDMTARKQVETALSAGESRYRSLFEDCPISLWEEDLSGVKEFFDELRGRGITDFRTHFTESVDDLLECVRRVRILNVNKATVDLLEAGSKDELLAGLDKVFTEDSLRVAVEEFSDLADGKTSYSGELGHRTMAGRTIRVAVHFNVAPEYRDTLGRVVVSLQDVTDVRRMQAELEQSQRGLQQRVEERTRALEAANEQLRREIAEREEVERMLRANEAVFRTLVDDMPMLIHAHDDSGRFVFWNRESERVLGYTSEDIHNKECLCRKLYPDDAVFAEIQRWHRAGSPAQREFEVRTKSGDTRLIRWTLMSGLSPIPGWSLWEAGIDMTDVRAAQRHVHALTHELLRAQENERSRIALELHDNVAQNLSSLKIGCETLFDEAGDVPESVRQRSKTLAGILQDCINAVRDMSYDLRPPGLEQLGLVQALEQFCNDSGRESGVRIELSSAGMDGMSLGYDVEINLYRLVQEAVRNALRHSGARLVRVKLVASSPHLILRVEDEGAGFDVEARRAALHGDRRMGLQSMEERARLLGGRFEITSRMDKGTKIFVQIPFGEK